MFYKYIGLGRRSLPNFNSISTSNHVRGLSNPTWTHTPWTPPPLGAAPNRLPPELAPHRTIEATKKSTELEFALLTLQLIHPFGETRPLQTNCQTGVLQVWCDEKTSTAKLQDSRLASNHVRGLSPPVGAAPNRLLLELAPHRTIEAITIQKNFTSHTLQLIHPFSWTRPLQTKCQASVLQVWWRSLTNFKMQDWQAIMPEGFATQREHTHSLDPSSAWSCTKQAATGASSSQDCGSYKFSRELELTPLPLPLIHPFGWNKTLANKMSSTCSTSILGWEDVHC